jgi:hypothetical protein
MPETSTKNGVQESISDVYRNHYGLAAAVFTTNLDSAIYISNTLRWDTQYSQFFIFSSHK